jgi:hypothetical protein
VDHVGIGVGVVEFGPDVERDSASALTAGVRPDVDATR